MGDSRDEWEDIDITEPMAWNQIPHLLDAIAKHLGVKFQRAYSFYGPTDGRFRVVPIKDGDTDGS